MWKSSLRIRLPAFCLSAWSLLTLVFAIPIQSNAPVDNDLSFGGSIKKEKWVKWTDQGLRSVMLDIFQRIDEDKDQHLSYAELTRWIKHVTAVGNRRVTLNSWNLITREQHAFLDWKEYLNRTYGSATDSDEFQTQIRHDERRWKAADLDEDGKLSFPEFAMFLHPHLYPVMRSVLSAEVLETMDQDKDAQVSEEEYISEIARAHRKVLYRGLPQPPWVEREKVQFRTYLDLDKNGSLDQQEIGEWLFPEDYDEVDAEVLHLLLYLDANQAPSMECLLLKSMERFNSITQQGLLRRTEYVPRKLFGSKDICNARNMAPPSTLPSRTAGPPNPEKTAT
ncbi:hypothetical protein CRM22_002611 [Opisthorchis felineus]|uniref:Reticulocalbin-3 n=1 Tax=Opisthorchis felineus TaxID=147828 RepID=A0A4S2M571_OPIFE|nr:hypothetical protein CRM22_002611 [Opisthorchis felineus]